MEDKNYLEFISLVRRMRDVQKVEETLSPNENKDVISIILREARKRSGLTADAFCKGICDYRTLYRIERGELGISVSNFQFLMSRIGGPKEVFPVFANRDDFDCCFALKHARFHLNSWQLDEAYKELQNVLNDNPGFKVVVKSSTKKNLCGTLYNLW